MGLFDDDFDSSAFGDDNDSLDFGDNSLDFGDNDLNFGDSDSQGGENSLFGGDADDSNPLTDGSLFDTGDTPDTPSGNDGELRLGGNDAPVKSKKTALIAIGVGVGILTLVFILASVLLNKDKEEDKPTGQVTHNVTNVDPNASGNNQGENSGNANDIMNDGPKRTQNNQVSASSSTDWISFDDSAGISFNKDYSSLQFTITGIEHFALRTDPNGNLEVKTELTGSISGYAGTYKLTVPYSKGCQLKTGMTFDVSVQVGEFKGKSVIGDIVF